MGCPGLIGVLLMLAQVPPPALGRTPRASWKPQSGRSWPARRSSSKALPSDCPEKAIVPAQTGFASGFPGQSTRMVPRDSCRFPKSSRLVPANKSEEPWRASLKEIESRSAQELFKLAQRAAKTDPPSYSLASLCLRAVLDREPDHREARRLLGYVPHDGGWARPFAVEQLTQGPGEPSDVRLGAGRLGAASRSWRIARSADRAARKSPLALGRRGQRPSSQLFPPLVHQHRTLRNPDQRHPGRGDQLRQASRGVS